MRGAGTTVGGVAVTSAVIGHLGHFGVAIDCVSLD
jgi:hypothetical protein